MKKIMEKIFSVLGTFFLFLFGDFDFLLKAILTLMLLDYITGVCKSFVKKKVNSSIGAKGIIKKVIYLCIIAVSVILDKMLNNSSDERLNKLFDTESSLKYNGNTFDSNYKSKSQVMQRILQDFELQNTDVRLNNIK